MSEKRTGPGFVVPKADGKVYVIEPVDSGRTGIDFVRKELEHTGPISARVVELFGAGGTSFAPVPIGTPLQDVLEFRGGGFMGIGASDPWMADYISSQWGKDAQLIFVDPWVSIIDQRLHPPKVKYFLTDTMIHYVPKTAGFSSALHMAVVESCSFLLVGFIVHPPVLLPGWSEQANPRMIEAIAQNTRAVFVFAYDQDGYVVWQRA